VYRVARVREVAVTGLAADRPEGFDLSAFWAGWETRYAADLPAFTARVRLGPAARRFRDTLGAFAPRSAVASAPDSGGWTRETLVFDSQRIAAAALLALTPEVEVLSPGALREELAALARAAVERFRG
jgi:hypothetical protein